MNSFYKVVQFLKDHFESDTFVHTITHGVVNNIDIDKKTIFPLVHFSVLNARVSDGVVIYIFRIWVLMERNFSKKPITDKFLKNDNELDNLNTTFAIANKFLTKCKLQRLQNDIEITEIPDLEAITYEFADVLDGWQFDVQLSIPNDVEVCG